MTNKKALNITAKGCILKLDFLIAYGNIPIDE